MVRRRPRHDDKRRAAGSGGPQSATRSRFDAGTRGYSINSDPRFGIGQRAFLIQTPTGKLPWDRVGLIDDPTVARIEE